ALLKPEKAIFEQEIQLIRDHINQHKIFTANRLLAEIPTTVAIPDRNEMQLQIGKALRKADQFFKLAEQLERLGRYTEAMEVADDLLAVVADTPGAEALQVRIQQSHLIAGDVGDELSDNEAGVRRRGPAGIRPPKPPPPGPWRTTLERIPRPSRAVIFGTIAVAACTAAGVLGFQDQRTLLVSQRKILQGQQLLAAGQYESAQGTLEAGRTTLESLSVLRFRKSRLDREIVALLGSPRLKEGLQGKVLYEGEYIPVDTATALREVQALTVRAQALDDADKAGEALALYQQAMEQAIGHKLTHRQAVIEESIRTLELRRALSVAEQAEQAKNWVEAAESYRQALRLSGDLPDKSTVSDITHRLTAAVFRHELNQSKKTFDQAQWQDAISSLKRARQLIAANPGTGSDTEREEVRQLLLNAQLFRMLGAARVAYQQQDWDVAIKEYQQALGLLAEEAASGGESVAESVAKVEKTLLLVRIAQLQEQVARAESRGDLNAVVGYRQEIQTMISRSRYARDPTVKAVAQKVGAQLVTDLEQQEVRRLTAWLEENFKTLFLANYPTFEGSELLQPRAILLKKIGRDRVFTFSCVECSQGSSSKLELLYRFNAKTGRWSAYKEE
ncbi:MAG: hypothetical protein RBT36_05885, partial [Desulfobulbus sp.]|nr:hypothetical protein [Desulfobulbus sp.]